MEKNHSLRQTVNERGVIMQKDIQPAYKIVDVVCACGAKFQIGTTKNVDTLKVEICSQCHPFYTGRLKYVDTAGRIEKFKAKIPQGGYASLQDPKKK